MTRKRLNFLWLALVAALVAFGASRSQAVLDAEPVLSSYFVAPANDATMQKVADLFEVHHRLNNGFEIIVPAARAAELFALVPDAKLLEADIHAEIRRADLTGYHDYQSIQTHLQQIADSNPQLATVGTYGNSKEGRALPYLTLTGKAAGQKTEVMVTASTHGNELITVEVVMGLLDRLATSYGKDERLTKIVDSHVIYFLPVINPDGYVRKSRYANGVDPNRDYPYPEEPNRRPNECIQAVMDFFDGKNIKGSLDYHSAAGMYMFPWSYTGQKVTADDYQRFATTAQRMAETNGYQHGQIPALLYIAKGASADYYYWRNQSLAMAVEIANSNVPPVSQIPHYVDTNAEALWIFLESVQ